MACRGEGEALGSYLGSKSCHLSHKTSMQTLSCALKYWSIHVLQASQSQKLFLFSSRTNVMNKSSRTNVMNRPCREWFTSWLRSPPLLQHAVRSCHMLHLPKPGPSTVGSGTDKQNIIYLTATQAHWSAFKTLSTTANNTSCPVSHTLV